MLGLYLPSLGLSGTRLSLHHPVRGSGPPRGTREPWSVSPLTHTPASGREGVGPWADAFVADSRSASPKGRSEDDSYDDEMLSAIEGLSSTR